ncbi:MAG TPA: CheR family methyltransferase [Streptosporangiaceae bacterium]|nr:CheR family methyltransferase [Streptosporangiaceae bacterium]
MTDEINSDRDFNELLAMMKESRGFDFTGYKRSTLERRINRRIAVVGLSSFAEYRDYLELEPEEFSQLFDSMLINVTSFFRDPLAWQALQERVVPELLSAKGAKTPIRVWSAGCATGEEAYTLAIVLAEAMGADQFRERVKIYATDLDEDALQQARAGTYEAAALADVPEELVVTYFEPAGTKRAFRRDLRRQVIFGRNDLTHDAPISRVDLLAARNTLMYFNAETQANIVRRFHFALSYPGYLFLGKAEMLLNHSDRFQPVDLRKRLFRKASPTIMVEAGTPASWSDAGGRGQVGDRLEGAALASGPAVQLAIDLADKLRVANSAAEALFNLRPRDLGRPFQDLEVSYRPVELRSRIDQVRKELRPIELHDVEWLRPGSSDPGYYDISVVPLFGASGDLIGVGVSFVDVTRYRRVRDELAYANTELERAYEELQSLNEELETTNEELQSTNEELETMNEELQSTNDELQVINEELRGRTEELDQTNSFLGTVLRSLGSAVIVLTEDLRVRVWSPGAEDLWGLRPDEAESRDILALDIGLPTAEIAPWLRGVLIGAGENSTSSMSLSALNRRGKTVDLRVAASPMRSEEGTISGLILVIDQTAAE